MDRLMLKYFVLKPAGDGIHAQASRKALRAYANVIRNDDVELSDELREWASCENAEAYARSIRRTNHDTVEKHEG